MMFIITCSTMADTLKKVKCYLKVLIDKDTLPQQKKALLSASSDTQVDAITVIAENSLKSELPIDNKDKKKLKKYKKILKKLASKKLKKNSKKRLIKKHYKIILVILLILKQLLEDLF